MTGLSDPLSPDQQRVVDLVGAAFLGLGNEWPVFDYVEGVLDSESKDAWSILQTFPEISGWHYGAVHWLRGAAGMQPSPETPIGLTVVGLSNCAPLRQHVDTFFFLVDFLTNRRKQTPPTPQQPRQLTVTSDDFAVAWKASRRLEPPATRLTLDPPRGGSSLSGGDARMTS